MKTVEHRINREAEAERIESARKITLSVLIPAYNYAAGLERILQAFQADNADVEILIYDDSKAKSLQAIVIEYQETFDHLVYQHNPSHYGAPLGAVKNWNALLDAATGKYVTLIHHDEFPYSAAYGAELLSELRAESPIDVYLLGLQIFNESLAPLSPHAPNWLRRAVVKYAPSYLFRRNVIGPTGTLIIRRSLALRFNTKLSWLVDVDFYCRLFSSGVVCKYCRNVLVGSVQRTNDSITATLKPDLNRVAQGERKILSEELGENLPWLTSDSKSLLKFFEAIVWYLLRAAIAVQFHLLSALGYWKKNNDHR